MRRLLTYLNALLLGVILGMIFLACVHAGPSSLLKGMSARRLEIGFRNTGLTLGTWVPVDLRAHSQSVRVVVERSARNLFCRDEASR